MLSELELPRVLAPDLSSNSYSAGGFKSTPLQLPSFIRLGIVMSLHVLRVSPWGTLRACCLP